MLNYLSHLSSTVQGGGGETDGVVNVEDAILKSRYVISCMIIKFSLFLHVHRVKYNKIVIILPSCAVYRVSKKKLTPFKFKLAAQSQ